MITPIQKHIIDGKKVWAKRDDLAQPSHGQSVPTGSKVRQFMDMAAKTPGLPMVVGCAATSAMQVYVAHAAAVAGVPAHVFTAARKVTTKSTQYAIDMGADVQFIRPGYMSGVRKAAKDKAKSLGGCVRWDVKLAIEDAAAQVVDIPDGVQRIIVPTGSGLTAAGIIVGLHRLNRRIAVHLVCVSGLATASAVLATADKHLNGVGPVGGLLGRPPFMWAVTSELHPKAYGQGVQATLGGVQLDPYYAAKAVQYVREFDLLWVPGCRPVVAF